MAFAHAACQAVADAHRIDLLHIKGPAVDPSIPRPNRGTDADVLVRPEHVAAFLGALALHGWHTVTTFDSGSPFGHAATLRHEEWGYVDVHRHFPGITVPATRAFDVLWASRGVLPIASRPCPVPATTAQRVLLVLNAARSSGRKQDDVETAWRHACPEEQAAVRTLVGELGADVAFAAGIGELERFSGVREYDLWRVSSQGGTRVEEWLARAKAAPDPYSSVRVLLRAVSVNTDHLRAVLGRPPTRREVAHEFFARPLRGLVELRRVRRDRA